MVEKKIDKKWFFLTKDGDLGFRYNNEFGNLCEKVFDNKKELYEFVKNSSVCDRFLKFYNKLGEVLSK